MKLRLKMKEFLKLVKGEKRVNFIDVVVGIFSLFFDINNESRKTRNFFSVLREKVVNINYSFIKLFFKNEVRMKIF